jgi:mlo protein
MAKALSSTDRDRPTDRIARLSAARQSGDGGRQRAGRRPTSTTGSTRRDRAQRRRGARAMAGGDGAGWSATKGYKLGGLFLALALLSIALARANVVVGRTLRKHKRSAMLHVFEHLQLELMLLGTLSLLLTALQDALMKICVKEEGSYGTDECPRGEGPLWSATTLHQTHIFIFILACTHVTYVAVSTYVCSWKLRQWRRWETEGEVKVHALNPKINPRNATGIVNLVWRAFWSQFRFAVDKGMYLSLRRLFLERTGATHDFNFYDYLRESMEEDMSSLIGMTVLMWSMATIFVTVPQALFLSAGIVCLGVMLFVGTMLESVALRLAQAAYERFADENELEERLAEEELDISIEKSPTVRRRELRKEIDSQNFFWLGRPRLLLKVYQFVLFENAISLSMLIFSMWQDKKWLTYNASMSVGTAWALFAVDVCVLMHSALFILPVYAITSTVGSHCATSLQEYADKLGITREAALQAYLERAKESMSTADAAEVAAYDLSLLGRDVKEVVSSGDFDHEAVPVSALPKDLQAVAGSRQLSAGLKDIQARGQARKSWAKAAGKLAAGQKDYSRENEKSITSLLGAILSNQMKAELAKQKREKEAKEAARAASPGVVGALQRTFSKKDIATMSVGQPSADDVTEDSPIPSSKVLVSRPSMKDVFSMASPPPKPTMRSSLDEEKIVEEP